MNRHSRFTRKSQLALLAGASLTALLATGSSFGETGEHHVLYLDALTVVTESPARLGAEMERIATGQVAHFDFVQNEHIELLRHARALQHPPASLDPASRDEIMADASALETAAASLEWVIADFLRAQALLGSALANTQDLVNLLTDQSADSEQRQVLAQLAAATQAMESANTPQARATLEAAYEQALALDIDPTRKVELARQRELVRDNATLPKVALTRLAEVEIEALATSLREHYLAATGPKPVA